VFPQHIIETSQMMLRLVPKIRDTVDMISGLNEFLRVNDAVMQTLRVIQSIKAQKPSV
jgi:hypothetical protein